MSWSVEGGSAKEPPPNPPKRLVGSGSPARRGKSGSTESAEHHEDRDRALGVARGDEGQLDVDGDGGVSGIFDVPDHAPGVDRKVADDPIGGLGGDCPGYGGDLGRDPAEDLALEVLHDLGSALVPPLRRRW
jgi:hypothetical protein